MSDVLLGPRWITFATRAAASTAAAADLCGGACPRYGSCPNTVEVASCSYRTRREVEHRHVRSCGWNFDHNVKADGGLAAFDHILEIEFANKRSRPWTLGLDRRSGEGGAASMYGSGHGRQPGTFGSFNVA